MQNYQIPHPLIYCEAHGDLAISELQIYNFFEFGSFKNWKKGKKIVILYEYAKECPSGSACYLRQGMVFRCVAIIYIKLKTRHESNIYIGKQ